MGAALFPFLRMDFRVVKLMNSDLQKQISKLLEKKQSACYILITCDEPTHEGKMNVEMTYKGDSDLAAYLIENAQTFFDQQQSFSKQG